MSLSHIKQIFSGYRYTLIIMSMMMMLFITKVGNMGMVVVMPNYMYMYM